MPAGAAHLPRPPRHHAGGPARARRRCCRTSPHLRQRVEPPARLRLEGRRSRRARRASRWRALIGARAKEIVFTSGATEANTLAIRGAVAARRDRGAHVVTVATEHKAVLDVCAGARARGLPRDRAAGGTRRPGRSGSLRRGAAPDTVLASVMTANNEIGVIQPVADAGAGLSRARRVAAHRRGAGGRPRAGRRRGARRRSGVDQRAQDVRPEGRRRALRAARAEGRRSTPQVVGGGQERGLRRRHAERARHRGLRRRGRPARAGAGRRGAARGGAARPAARRGCGRRSRR